MIRRTLIASTLSAMASACSPLGALNTLGPRDRGASCVARDVAYGPDARQRLDIYAPATIEAPLPTLVFFYGGGWHSGSKGLYGWVGQALAAQGFLVMVPDYRLVPEVHFPAFIEDAAAATAHGAQIAGRHGGDGQKLGVIGHSAGAHLATMITLDERYMRSAGRAGAIRACAGLAGPYEFLPLDVAASINAFSRAPDLSQTQPITFARADAPPLWLGHGAEDRTVHAEDTHLLHQALIEAGASCEKRIYEGLNHADLIATFSPLFRRRAPVLADVSAFFARTLT